MKSLLLNLRNFLSWIAAPLIAMCPLCTFTAVFIAFGQVSFLFTLARVLTPILITLILVSVLSFYLGFRIHRSPLPVVLAVFGGAFIIYANVGYLVSIFFQVFGILLLSSAALIDL